MRHSLVLTAMFVTACASEPTLDLCSRARETVAACAGEEAAAELATTCTDAIATEVLATTCEDDAPVLDSKADGSTASLSRTLRCGTSAPALSMLDVGDGIELHTACQGSGPTIVLLHGWPESWITWRPVMAELARNGFRVIAPDLRGYNLSSRPFGKSHYTYEKYTTDIATLIESLDVGPVIVAGHDIGGFVAWFLADAHPELVRGLAVLDASHPDVLRDLMANHAGQREALAFWNLLNAFQWPAVVGGFFYEEMLDRAFAHHTSTPAHPVSILTASERREYLETWTRSSLPWRHAMVTMIDGYKANLDIGPAWNAAVPRDLRIDMPTLVMWGAHDVALLAEPNLAGLRARVPHLTTTVFADAGHYLTHEKPLEVARALAAFARNPIGAP